MPYRMESGTAIATEGIVKVQALVSVQADSSFFATTRDAFRSSIEGGGVSCLDPCSNDSMVSLFSFSML